LSFFMLCCAAFSFAQTDQDAVAKGAVDVEGKYTSVGNIGLTVTNFGTIGTRNTPWPRQPSCEYPRGSRIEHIYQGAIWVGALLKTQDPSSSRNNQFLVSTGVNDRSSSSRGASEGYEFRAAIEDSMTELSTLSADRPAASQFSPLAVSHQDFIADYKDTPLPGDSILSHTPLGISVHQEGYAWNFPFADFFVILKYRITNTSHVDTLDSVYVGFWNNAVVRNTNLVRPGTTGYFDHSGNGFDQRNRMAYSFDFDGIPGGPPADSYVGVKLLGATPFPQGVDSLGNMANQTFYNAWQFRLSSGDAAYLSPTDDYLEGQPFLSRYSRMTQSMPQDKIDALRLAPKNVTYLLSTGPWHRIEPDSTIEVVFAVVCARKNGSAPANNDTPDQRKILMTNVGWAQQAYNGEDANGNNVLDAGEDIARRDSVSPNEVGLRYEPDGVITRYLLPAPPKRPKVHVEVQNQSAAIYWDKVSAEQSIDPITGQKDFEGYRIYRSNTAEDFLSPEDFLLNLSLVGEFDRSDDNVGYNTGFSRVLLDQPVTFPGDTTAYWYRFPPAGAEERLLNGWQYVYGVSAFDRGDSANSVESLESAKFLQRVVPGTVPVSDYTTGIGVYPNPYYANAYWDGGRERLRKIYFYNLPALCEIKVYTLAGDVVTVIEHDGSSYTGEGIEWFTQYGGSAPAKFSGGEHAWDLISRYDQAIATGLYLFTVEDKATGDIKRGKFLIIK
jgi:hypothetical protein